MTGRQCCHAVVVSVADHTSPPPIHVSLCVEGEVFDRLGPILRHLVVGLVDGAVRVRLVGTDTRMESLSLGPVRTLIHARPFWPYSRRWIDRVIEGLAPDPPTVTHALSCDSYELASAIAEAFDGDLVFQVSSEADCNAIARLDTSRVGSFVAMSQPLADVLGSQLRVPPERVELVRLGVRASRESRCMALPQQIRTVLSTAPFTADGGVEKVLRAVQRVLGDGHRLVLFLLGSGPRESTLRRVARELGIQDSVAFAHPMGDWTKAMESADIFVHSSQDRTVTVDALQAMGVGTAVVAFASAVCDHFRHEETALVCPEPTAGALAAAIEHLLVDPAQTGRLAASALDYVRAHHSWSVMAERTAAVYRRLALVRATFVLKE